MADTKSRHPGVRIIGGFKLFKGLLLIAVACGVVAILHEDVESAVTRMVQWLNLDTNSRYFQIVMEKVLRLSPNLPLLGIGTFVYGAMFAVEGVGLLLAKRWAEYLTVIVTASFLPLEAYEMMKHPSVAKAVTIVLNLAIVIYLIIRLKRDKPRKTS